MRGDRLFERDHSRWPSDPIVHGHLGHVVYRRWSSHPRSWRFDGPRSRSGNPKYCPRTIPELSDRRLGCLRRPWNYLGDRTPDQDWTLYLCHRWWGGFGGALWDSRPTSEDYRLYHRGDIVWTWRSTGCGAAGTRQCPNRKRKAVLNCYGSSGWWHCSHRRRRWCS